MGKTCLEKEERGRGEFDRADAERGSWSGWFDKDEEQYEARCGGGRVI